MPRYAGYVIRSTLPEKFERMRAKFPSSLCLRVYNLFLKTCSCGDIWCRSTWAPKMRLCGRCGLALQGPPETLTAMHTNANRHLRTTSCLTQIRQLCCPFNLKSISHPSPSQPCIFNTRAILHYTQYVLRQPKNLNSTCGLAAHHARANARSK